MAQYQIVIEKQAERQLRRLPRDAERRVSDAITALRKDPRPHGAKKLVGAEAWRIRIGDYRVVYEIRDRQLVILVVRIAHHRDVYR